MHILVFGSGLMGPAAAYKALADPRVDAVTICDLDAGRLEASAARLRGSAGSEKLRLAAVDVRDVRAVRTRLEDADAAVSALPWTAAERLLEAAVASEVPFVDLCRVADSDYGALKQRLLGARGLVVLGCGVEPGLTEMLARHLAERLEKVEEVHIKCGGVPDRPSGPLGYRIVFGGTSMPLHDSDGLEVEEGRLIIVPRYSGVEAVTFEGVGVLEAWHEGFMPWLVDLPVMKGLRRGSQKTIRWPGYAAKVSVLKEMGLLGTRPIEVDGTQVIPKRLVDALLYPEVHMRDSDRDLTLLRVDVIGRAGGRRRRLRAEMVDRHDGSWSSMARTTAFTAAAVACMAASGKLPPAASALVTPEQVVAGPLLDELLADLAAFGIRFSFTEADPEESNDPSPAGLAPAASTS